MLRIGTELMVELQNNDVGESSDSPRLRIAGILLQRCCANASRAMGSPAPRMDRNYRAPTGTLIFQKGQELSLHGPKRRPISSQASIPRTAMANLFERFLPKLPGKMLSHYRFDRSDIARLVGNSIRGFLYPGP
jgi:hypothetical protein